MVKRTIVLPLEDNGGISLRPQLDQARASILAIAGGYSEHDSSGVWVDSGGHRFVDRSTTLTVVSDPATDARILATLPTLAALLRQEALYTDATAADVAFVAPAAAVAAAAAA